MKNVKIIQGIGSLAIALLMFTGCAEDVSTSKMSVKFGTENPKFKSVENRDAFVEKDLTLLNAIYLDVIQCEVHYSSPSGFEGWHELPTVPGIYNLLDIDSDATVVLVHDTLMPHGNVEQFRLILGPNNTIDIGGTIYPLSVPSAQQSGLKINLNEELTFTSAIEVVLLFDPYHSIVEQGNGGYLLKPVIQVDIVNQL